MAKKNVPYDEKYYDDVETWPREKLEELARTRYWLPGWRTDAESLSGVLNAAGRSGEAGLGVAAGMGDAESLKAAEEIDRASSRELLEAVLAVDREGLVQMENIQLKSELEKLSNDG